MRSAHKDIQPADIQTPEMSILSWQEQFVVETVATSGTLKDNNYEADKVFLQYIRMTPSEIAMVEDVIVLIKEDKKVQKILLNLISNHFSVLSRKEL